MLKRPLYKSTYVISKIFEMLVNNGPVDQLINSDFFSDSQHI